VPDNPNPDDSNHAVVIGRWIRHHRKVRGLTLEELSARVGRAASHLSLIETGKREPKASLLGAIAAALDVPISALMGHEAPDRRSELEIALQRAQTSALYTDLGLPTVRPSKAVPTEALEALVGLHEELSRRTTVAAATPEEARKANAELRMRMREHMNYFPDIEKQASAILEAVGHRGGPVGERRISQIAEHLGFTLHYVPDLPHSTRSVTDLRNRRIYLPAGARDGHDPRTIVLQTLGHHVLGHETPSSYADFLQQRVDVNYFAAALLIGEAEAVELLERGKEGRYLAVEDIRDAFAVSHETAAHRFTNLATKHLGFGVHFLKIHEGGTIYKAYENNGLPLPVDSAGAIEGQVACRYWASRQVFTAVELGKTHYQYADTPVGTFWSSVYKHRSDVGIFSLSVGVSYADSKWFRGRETRFRTKSTCPDQACCQRPPRDLSQRWAGHAWPSARAQSHLLATLPPGTFPGEDTTAVYAFLDRHAPEGTPVRESQSATSARNAD
jgi:XRE family transcriptional regulator, fatty acid utilization regulator